MSVPTFPTNMTSNNTPTPYVASASTFAVGFEPYKAFNSAYSTSTFWRGTGGGVDQLEIDLGASTYAIQTYEVRIASTTNRAPKNWTFQGSNDNSTWTTLDTQTNQTGWNANQTKFYSFINVTTYRYYRLNITANNGDATNTEAILFGLTDISPYGGYGGNLSSPHITIQFQSGPKLVGSSGPSTPVPVAKVLQQGFWNRSYLETIAATGGTGGYTFSILSGSLPTGLSINTSTGVISGVPTVVGTYDFTVKVVDSSSNVGTTLFEITIWLSPGVNSGFTS